MWPVWPEVRRLFLCPLYFTLVYCTVLYCTVFYSTLLRHVFIFIFFLLHGQGLVKNYDQNKIATHLCCCPKGTQRRIHWKRKRGRWRELLLHCLRVTMGYVDTTDEKARHQRVLDWCSYEGFALNFYKGRKLTLGKLGTLYFLEFDTSGHLGV